MIWMIAGIVVLLLSLPGGQYRKGGVNDLRRWKRFGGTLERPSPPARRQ